MMMVCVWWSLDDDFFLSVVGWCVCVCVCVCDVGGVMEVGVVGGGGGGGGCVWWRRGGGGGGGGGVVG